MRVWKNLIYRLAIEAAGLLRSRLGISYEFHALLVQVSEFPFHIDDDYSVNFVQIKICVVFKVEVVIHRMLLPVLDKIW